MASVQFCVVPSFHHLTFDDGDDVSEVLKHVLQARNKSDDNGETLRIVQSETNARTVGELRCMTDSEWAKMKKIPAMCRVYLKYIVRQSKRTQNKAKGTSSISQSDHGMNGNGALMHSNNNSSDGNGQSNNTTTNNNDNNDNNSNHSNAQQPAVASSNPRNLKQADIFLRELEMDFNFGQPFDLTPYSAQLNKLKSMGFHRNEAMEALLVSEKGTVQSALEILIIRDAKALASKRSAAIHRLGRQASLNLSQLALSQASALPQPLLVKQVSLLQKEFERERQTRGQLENDIKNRMLQFNKDSYREFLRGLISDGNITPQATESLQRYRSTRNISSADHTQTLRELGMDLKQFDELKNFQTRTINECVVCLDKPKNHLVFNCMHMCLCEDCAPKFASRNSKCPLCNKPVYKIIKVFL